MIKNVIFDLDGTILDSMKYWVGVGRDFLMRHGVTSFPDDFLAKVRAMSLEQSSNYFREQFGIECSIDDIMDGMKDIVASKYRFDADFKPNVKATLDELAGEKVKMCIATATYASLVDEALTRLHVRDRFEFILSCSDVGYGKDNPLVFDMSMARLGGNKDNTLIVEDSLHAIKTAKDAGYKVLAVEDADQECNRAEIQRIADKYVQYMDAKTIIGM